MLAKVSLLESFRVHLTLSSFTEFSLVMLVRLDLLALTPLILWFSTLFVTLVWCLVNTTGVYSINGYRMNGLQLTGMSGKRHYPSRLAMSPDLGKDVVGNLNLDKTLRESMLFKKTSLGVVLKSAPRER